MAIKADTDYYEFASTSKPTPHLSLEITNHKPKKMIPFYRVKSSLNSGKIMKPKCSSLNWFSKSLIMHLQKPEFLHSHCVLKKNNYCGRNNAFADDDSEMNEIIENVRLKRKFQDFNNSKFSMDQNVIMDDNMLSTTDIESDSSVEHFSPRFNSPIDQNSSQSSKSQSSIEDLNKEIEKLFLNNSEKYGFSSFVWDQGEIAEGRRAPISDMLTSYKAQNHKKKRRSATALGIRNYKETDSSNGNSSQDEISGCEEADFIQKLTPPIIVPVPVGKSSVDQLDCTRLNIPFSGTQLRLSEDSAFAPIKSTQRSQSTPLQDTIDVIEDHEEKIF
ncbi:uncharacterized protein LOC135831629 [Planococcus citri]|uniref:uncharacterized protein LOC135831629 n=1 Tax=Planococcus citri TaxID=170843 RepID=UPI0031F946B5